MPRSASRDLADRFLGNRRYFRRWNRLERLKLALSGVALLGVLAWGAMTLSGTGRGGVSDYQATHGPLASVHAAWDRKCDACHQPNSGDGLLDAHGRWNTFTCQKCHAAGEHVANMKPDYKVQDCAGCHKDHNGRDAKLTRLDDASCVSCHRNLETIAAKPSMSSGITAFDDRSHPDFKSITGDKSKRQLNFSHSQHLTPGMVLTPGGKNALTLSELQSRSEYAGRYYKQYADAKSGLIQLDCRACHEQDGNGNYKRVAYEAGCASCHPTLTPTVVTDAQHVLTPVGVPHGEQYTELRKLLFKEYAVMLLSKHPKVAEMPGAKVSQMAGDPVVQAYTQEVGATADRAVRRLFDDNCRKCHSQDSVSYSDIPKIDDPRIFIDYKYKTRWFASVRFDHRAHQAASCISCHPGAVLKIGTPEHEVEREPVDIPNIDNCRQCHAPQSIKDGVIRGGIKHGCTDCHTYHHADKPEKRQRDLLSPGKPTLTVDDFLRGGTR